MKDSRRWYIRFRPQMTVTIGMFIIDKLQYEIIFVVSIEGEIVFTFARVAMAVELSVLGNEVVKSTAQDCRSGIAFCWCGSQRWLRRFRCLGWRALDNLVC